MSTSVYGKGINGLLKKYWHEVPGATAATFIGIIGLGLMGYNYQRLKNGPKIPKYKEDYIVVRPDDPIVNEPVRTYPF
ncbi:uncharacterized protein [Halyomorpha halys]|uniref:uncharacterized protein n=1 Tax=Halyomorpha halys TaxID=286706 RepID=UPI0006D4CB02|nr:uncharacterized protein LOC106686659 [Halyomorpha halys]